MYLLCRYEMTKLALNELAWVSSLVAAAQYELIYSVCQQMGCHSLSFLKEDIIFLRVTDLRNKQLNKEKVCVVQINRYALPFT